mmetsp:Transcript_21744/g.49440  ORF Transcript_21744/g.49440 Transcript_21744/m.49440 type:complete len:342 (-) Transcript_21744:775-1800(-)
MPPQSERFLRRMFWKENSETALNNRRAPTRTKDAIHMHRREGQVMQQTCSSPKSLIGNIQQSQHIHQRNTQESDYPKARHRKTKYSRSQEEHDQQSQNYQQYQYQQSNRHHQYQHQYQKQYQDQHQHPKKRVTQQPQQRQRPYQQNQQQASSVSLWEIPQTYIALCKNKNKEERQPHASMHSRQPGRILLPPFLNRSERQLDHASREGMVYSASERAQRKSKAMEFLCPTQCQTRSRFQQERRVTRKHSPPLSTIWVEEWKDGRSQLDSRMQPELTASYTLSTVAKNRGWDHPYARDMNTATTSQMFKSTPGPVTGTTKDDEEREACSEHSLIYQFLCLDI